MDNIFTRLKSSMRTLWRNTETEDMAYRIEYIRDAMLDALAPYGEYGTVLPPAWHSIAMATDVQTLWHLRTQLLSVLADLHGERQAQRMLAELTEHFRGAIPDAQMPRLNSFKP